MDGCCLSAMYVSHLCKQVYLKHALHYSVFLGSNFVQSLNEAKEEAAMELRGKGKPDL